MICPHCNDEIVKVMVNSNAFQTGYLKEYAPGVWGIDSYGDDITIEDTMSMQCPSCWEDIPMLRDDYMFATDGELARLSAQESDRVNSRISIMWDNQPSDLPPSESEPF